MNDNGKRVMATIRFDPEALALLDGAAARLGYSRAAVAEALARLYAPSLTAETLASALSPTARGLRGRGRRAGRKS